MKDRPDAILRPAQARYLDSLLFPRHGVLAEMEEYAREHGVPISDPEVGRLLQILARSTGAHRILELGTAIGYGTLCLLQGEVSGRVTTIERDPEMVEVSRKFLDKAGVLEAVKLLEGEAVELVPELEGPFDLVYLDCDKDHYRKLLDQVLPKLTVGGVVVVDNLLWKGLIAEPPGEPDEKVRLIEAFNAYLMAHPQLESVLLPLGDGVGLAVKSKPLMSELGGPF